MFIKILIRALFFFFICFYSLAENSLKNLIIEGNNRILKSTISEIINFEENKIYSIEEINLFQKKLFETNFFKFAKISIKDQNLIITVEENPLINFFFIDGEKNKEREDFIYENISLKQSQIFSEALLKKDIEKIKNIYLSSGYYNIEILPKVTKLENNLVNIVLTVERGEQYKINRVYFIGDKFFSSSTLKNVISSTEHGWWKFLSSTSSLNENRVEFDKKLLNEYYLNNGFFDVQILLSEIEIASEKKANIIYSINAGPKYKFNDITIIDDKNNLTDQLKKQIDKISKKKIINENYSLKLTRNLRDQINQLLNINKIEFVDLNIRAQKINDKINLNLIFDDSERLFVDQIKTSGNSITEEKVIRRELYFSEGDTFTKNKLDRSIRNINRTGIFKNVKINKINKSKELVDIEINVEEQPTGSISAGLGVGTSGTNVSTGIQEKNLFGKGIIANSNLTFGTEKISGSVNLDLPDFLNSGNTFGYDLFAISTDFENAGYESKKIGNAVSVAYNLYEDVTLRSGLGIDLDSIDTSSSASALYKSREGDYLTTKTFYNINTDKRDQFIRPTKGHRLSFGQTLAIPPSDIPYFGNDIFASYYHSLNDDFILNLKGGASTINGFDNKKIKLSDRKFLTNKQIRGFENYGIGPISGTDHIGGNYSIHSSLSTTVPNGLPEKWNANSILFLDAANVWSVDFDSSLDSDKIRSTAGIALDWISPLGPLNFTFAEIISSAPGDVEENFSFQIGSSF